MIFWIFTGNYVLLNLVLAILLDGFLFMTFGEIDRDSLRDREREFPKLY